MAIDFLPIRPKMKIENYFPSAIDWGKIPSEKRLGETGFTVFKTRTIGEIKIRFVEYSKGYLSDHWCDKGHLIFVLEGELILEHKDNSEMTIKKGMSYLAGDNSLAHRGKSVNGAKVFIVD